MRGERCEFAGTGEAFGCEGNTFGRFHAHSSSPAEPGFTDRQKLLVLFWRAGDDFKIIGVRSKQESHGFVSFEFVCATLNVAPCASCVEQKLKNYIEQDCTVGASLENTNLVLKN